MDQSAPPGQPLGVRTFIGGFAILLLAFGAITWSNGRDIPWGYQQTAGAIAAGIGVLALAACFVRFTRRPVTPPNS